MKKLAPNTVDYYIGSTDKKIIFELDEEHKEENKDSKPIREDSQAGEGSGGFEVSPSDCNQYPA